MENANILIDDADVKDSVVFKVKDLSIKTKAMAMVPDATQRGGFRDVDTT